MRVLPPKTVYCGDEQQWNLAYCYFETYCKYIRLPLKKYVFMLYFTKVRRICNKGFC